MTSASTSTTGKRPLAFIALTIVIDSLGFGIIIPVVPELIMELSGEGLGSAARYGGWLLFSYAMMQFLCAPVLGNLSDRFGRRPILLCSLFVFGLDYLVMSVAPDLAWLFIARVVAGMVGATHATANAYVADISPPEERAQNFGKLGAAWGLGFILGPVVGGLLGGFGSRVPFLVAAGLALTNVLYGYFVLPESLPPESRRPFRLTRANPLGALRQMRAYPFVVGVLATVVLYQIAHDANPSTWTYYTMLKFGWSEREVGYSMGAVGILLTVVQAGGIRIAIERLGERATVHTGLLVMAVGYAGFSLSGASWMMYLFMVPFALGGVAMPALRGLMANEVPEDSQGALQGAITSIASLTAIGAPVFMTQLFGAFARSDATGAATGGGGLYFPGAPFLAAAILVALGALWFARTLRVTPPGVASRPG